VQVVAIALLSAVVFYFSVQELPQFMQRALVPLYSVQLVVTALLFVIVRGPSVRSLAAEAPT
jgi:hypothetical protein